MTDGSTGETGRRGKWVVATYVALGKISARFSSAPKSLKLSLAGLAVGVLGLLVQWAADPAKFGGFPPGIIFVAACGALTVVTVGRWWAPIFSVLISLWIVFGGLAAGKMIPNFSKDLGTITGTAVMALGLLLAAMSGVLAMIQSRRPREYAKTL